LIDLLLSILRDMGISRLLPSILLLFVEAALKDALEFFESQPPDNENIKYFVSD